MISGVHRRAPPCASQSADRVAPIPRAGQQGRQALDARPECLVGERRSHLPHGRRQRIAEQHERQDRRDAPMPQDRPQPVDQIGNERFARAGRRTIPLRRAQTADAEKINAVADDVAGEGDRRSEMQDHPAGERRTDEDSHLGVGSRNADRGGEAPALDEARQEPVGRRYAEGVDGAVQDGHRGEAIDREMSAECQTGEAGGLERGEPIGDQQHAEPVVAVRQHAPERHQGHVGHGIHQGHGRKPARGMRHLPGRPGHRDGLDEEAEPGHDRADRVAPEIAVAESLADAAEQSEQRAGPVRRSRSGCGIV